MKKTVGVVAAATLAAMPAIAAFAVDPVTITDNLTLNVNEACAFSAGGSGLALEDTVSVGGTTTWSTSSHAFVIKCNSKAYSVTAQATDLVKTGAAAHGTIAFEPAASYAETSIGDDGKWTAVLTGGDTSAAIATTSSVIKSGKATTTDNFSVAYKGYAGNAQEQGAYKGTVTYILTGSNS